jgi:ankyrin repeat protein
VNHADNLAGQTPLYYAARRGHLEMCRVLVEKGADVSHLDSSNKTAAEYAKKSKHYDIAEYLVNEIKRTKDIKFSLPSQSREESNLEKRKKKEDQKNIRQTYKIVFLNEKGQARDLTEEDVRQMIKAKPEIEGYLANPESLPQELIDASNGDHW